MSPDTQVALIGGLLLIAYVAFHVIRVWREQNEFERDEVQRRHEALLDDRDRFVSVCEQLTAELIEADQLAINQARKSLAQQDRIAELESRGLPYITEPREATTENPPLYLVSRARATGDGVRL